MKGEVMKGKRVGKRWFYVLMVAAMLVMFSPRVWAEEFAEGATSESNAPLISFHGYFQMNAVLRDGGGGTQTSGLQYGYMDHLSLIQQRNSLKFDIDVEPNLTLGDFGLKKIHMTYRGAYDSIFDFRDKEFGRIPENRGLSRFDYSLRDIRFENDLREVFVDFTYDGPLGSAFFRPGRQLVSWGETTGQVLLDVINPADNSFQMFFQSPDDLKIPIYMARLNYSIPTQADFGLNFDFLWIPDIRPDQLAPTDKSMSAPYISILTTLAGLGRVAASLQQDVPTEKQEYGAKITAYIGQRLSVSLVYFRDVNNALGMVITSPAIPTATALFTHNVQDVYGGYFSYQFTPLDIVIRGEVARQSAMPITLPSSQPDRYNKRGVIGGLQTFRYKPVTAWMVGVDKSKTIPWISNSATSFGFQWIHKTIEDWEDVFVKTSRSSAVVQNQDILTFSAATSWLGSKLVPVIACNYNPGQGGEGGGTAVAILALTYQISPHVAANVTQMSFWGDKDAKSGYAGFIGSSETALKLTYEW